MKVSKTVFFILCTLALLATLSYYWPADGIGFGSYRLRFPSLSQVFSVGTSHEDAPRELTPEELLELRMQALMEAQDSTFLDFCFNSPIRIQMPLMHVQCVDSLPLCPNDTLWHPTDSLLMLCDSLVQLHDSTVMAYDSIVLAPDSLYWLCYRDSLTQTPDLCYFDSLFYALDQAKEQHVRIIHYGDSQLEEDRITSSLREHFQTEFGGGGPGMQPAMQTVRKMTVSQSTTPQLNYYLIYGPASTRASHRAYGPMGQFSHLNGSVSLRYTGLKSDRFPHCQKFNRVTLMRSVGDSLRMEVHDYDSLQTSVTLNISGPTDIYGILLDQRIGVAMDNVPMRGASGDFFSTIQQSTMRPFFKQQNVRLIILQYGGNAVPYLRSDDAIERFCLNIQKQIRYFQQLKPEARILFIGPSDMSTTIQGQKQTYPQLPTLVDMLSRKVTEAGAAFWNMYEAMGGEGSMIQWVDARPQLAGEDYVHFTHKGAQRISDLLYETIDTYYKYYKFRIGEYELQLPTDSLALDSLTIDSLLVADPVAE